MEKNIFIVRHCKAEGQPPEAELTEKGFNQANALSDFFSEINIDRVISSQFIRAVQSIAPLAEMKNVKVEIDTRLAERTLSTRNFPDWLEKLESTFIDMDLKYEGGESSREAKERALNVIDDIFKTNDSNTIIVTHGNLMALLLKHFDHNFGFEQWKALRNPDVFRIQYWNNNVAVDCLWEDGYE